MMIRPVVLALALLAAVPAARAESYTPPAGFTAWPLKAFPAKTPEKAAAEAAWAEELKIDPDGEIYSAPLLLAGGKRALLTQLQSGAFCGIHDCPVKVIVLGKDGGAVALTANGPEFTGAYAALIRGGTVEGLAIDQTIYDWNGQGFVPRGRP